MDAKCILNEFYQRYRIAGLNYEFEETENAGFTCILALPAVPSGGNSSSQDQKGLQTPLSFHGTGSSKKKAAHAAAEAAVTHLQQQGLLTPPPGPSSSPAVGSKRSKANEEEETEPLQQRVLEALLACHPATLTAAALTKRCGDWMRKPKVNHLLYNPLSDAGLVEMVDDKQTPAWRATAAAVEAVRAAAVAAGALPCGDGPAAAGAVAAAPAGEEAAGGGTGGALVPVPGEVAAQEGAVPAAAAAAAGGAAGVDRPHLIEGPLAGACTGKPTACTTMAAGAVDEAGPSTWVAALTEGQLAAAVAQVLARLTAEGVLTVHAAASGAASPVSSGKRTRSGAAAASGGQGGATSSASRPGSAHLREQQQRLGLLAALNQTATSRPTAVGDGGYTAGRASGGGAAAVAAVAGGCMRPGWKRATSESAGVSWTSAHTTSGNTAAASHGCPPSPAAADAQDTATSSSSRRLPPVAGHRASPQAYSTRGGAPPVAVGSGSTGVFSPWQRARSSVGHPASKVPRTAADAMGSVHGLYPWGSSQLQQQAALGFVGSRGGQHLTGASLLGHQQQQGRAEMTAESLQGVLGGSLHLGSPVATTRAPDTAAAAAAAAGSHGCAANWGHPEQLQHQHQLREQVVRQAPNRAAAGLGASPGALHAAAMGAGLTSADDLEVLLSGLNHISSLPGAVAAADVVQRLGSGQLAPAAGPAPAAAIAAQVQLPGASIWTPSGGMLAPSTSAGGARGSSQGGAHSGRGLGPTSGGEQEGCSDDEVSPAVLAAAVEAACLEPAPLAADAAHTAGVYNAGPSAEAAAAAAGPTRNRSSSQGLQDPQLLLQGPRQQPVGPSNVRPANSSSSQQASGAHGPPPHPAAAAAEAPGVVAAAAVRHDRSGTGHVGSPRSRWSPLTAFDHLTSATLAPIPPATETAAAVAAGVDMPHTFAAFGHNASSSSHHLAGGSLHPMALDLPAVPPAAAAAGAVGGGPAEGVGLKRKLPSTDSTEERAWCSPRTHHHHHQHQQQQQWQQQHQQAMQSQQQAQGGDGGDAMCDEAPAGHKPYHHRQQHLQGIGPSLGAGMAGEGGNTPAAPRRRSQGDFVASGASPPEQQQQQPQQQQEAEVAFRRRLKRQARQLDQASASSGGDEEQQVAAGAVGGTAQGQGDPLVAVRHLSEPLSVSGDTAVTDPTDMDSCAVSMTLGPDPAATAMAAAAAAAAGGLDGHHRSITPAAAAGGVGEEVEGVYEGTSSSLRTAAAAAAGVGGMAGGVSEDQALELLSRLTLPELPGGAANGAARHHSHTTPGVAGAPAGDATPQDHLWQLTAGLGGLGLMQPGSDAHPAVDLAAEAATGLGAPDMQGRTQNANKRLKPLPPQLQEEYDRRVQNVRHLVLQLNEALQGLRSIQDQAGTPPGTGGTS